MNSLLDVIQCLKKFGIFIYTGDRSADLDLMQEEIKDLLDAGLLAREDYVKARLIIQSEQNRVGK